MLQPDGRHAGDFSVDADYPAACVCIEPEMSAEDPTADYRKYPKGPNFGLIVALASIVLVVLLIAAVFLIGGQGKKLAPNPPNPQPNSMVQPLLPVIGIARLG